MFGLLGLAAAALGLAILLLPFWSFVRVYRLTAEVARLRARLDQLERGVRLSPAPDVHAAPQSAPSSAPSPAPPSAPSFAPPSAPPPAPDDLESRVGGRWLLYAGVAILLVGVSFFLKYAFDNDWISPAMRVLVGLLAGLGLAAAGWRIARTLETFGLALTGVGLASLYLSIYAAFGLYALVGPWTAFAAMVGTTLLATALADRGRSQALAMIAAVGGFLTPFLVTGTSHETVLLLSYLLLLAAGIMVLSARHRWASLAATGYVLTLAALAVWAASGYADDEWLIVLAFLTGFCALFVWMLRDFATRKGEYAFVVTALLFTAPFFYHLAALAITSNHLPAFQLYLIVFTAAGLLLTTTPHRGWLRLIFLLGAYLPFLGFLQDPGGASLAANLVTAIALAVLHVVAMLDRLLRQEERLALPDLLVLHASMVGLFGLLSQILAVDLPDWRGGAGAILALGAAGLWFFLARRDPVTALNAAGLSFTLVALAIAVQFDGRVAVIGWAAEGAAAAWIGLRASSPAFRAGGLALVALAAIRLSENYVQRAGEGVAVFNARSLATLVLVVLAYLLARAWRHRRPSGSPSLVPIALHAGAAVFTMMWLSAEIATYWDARPRTVQAALGEELMRSLAWSVYGAALIVIGMWRALPSIRWIGIAVIGITILKVFLIDLSRLGGIYRVAGFLVIGVLLVMVSYLYQRTREARHAGTPEDPAAGEAGGTP